MTAWRVDSLPTLWLYCHEMGSAPTHRQEAEMGNTYDHQETARAMAAHVESERRRYRRSIPATPEAVLGALGGSYTVGRLTRYNGGGGCTQQLLGRGGWEVRLSDSPGRPATAELVGPDLMGALLASVERENARAGR